MINVFIDTSSISEKFDIDQRQIDNLLDYTIETLTRRFAQQWEIEANQTLVKSRQEYISNIVVVDEGFAKGAVMLLGWLPNAIEQGHESYDLKEFLLSGPKAKTGKDGNSRYNTIPFSFGTPDALPENFSNIMPKPVYDAVKSKPLVNSIRGGGLSSKPLKKDEIPSEFRSPQKKLVKMPNKQEKVEFQHKHSIYEGLTKRQDPVTKQNSYGTFRRVSDNSPKESWIHPGFDALHLSDKALQKFDIPNHVGSIIDEWLQQNLT